MAVNDHTALVSTYLWEKTDQQLVVTYSLTSTLPTHWLRVTSLPDGLLETFQSAGAVADVVHRAFQIWEDATGIQFVQSSNDTAHINMGLFDFTATDMGNTIGFAYYPSTWSQLNSTGGDLFIHQEYATYMGLWLHEIGHALGLNHPHEGVILDPSLDTTTNTIMSYNGALPDQVGYLDVAAIAAMYGPGLAPNMLISEQDAKTRAADGVFEHFKDAAGNSPGAIEAWDYWGDADLEGDGTDEFLFYNPELARWAFAGLNSNGLIDFRDHGAGGETRVTDAYVDPLIGLGLVKVGSTVDSQTRFENDLRAGNLQFLDVGDFNNDGAQNLYFRTADNGVFLNALLHGDGTLRYANYQTTDQMIDYIESYGGGSEAYGSWLLA